MKSKIRYFKSFLLICVLAFGTLHFALFCYSQENKQQPLIVNGDVVEYSTDQKEVTASGHVQIIYKGSTLTCQKITVNTMTKEAVAEGNPRLDDQRGVIEGSKIIYNFETGSGTIIDSQFRANPYFGKARKLEKVGELKYVAEDGYATTCSLDRPHYRIGSKEIELYPEDKIRTKGNAIYAGDTPIFYIPELNRSLKDQFMHGRVIPGNRKEWGPFLLTAWRYNLTQNLNGKVYLDYRSKLGVAEGLGLNYKNDYFGSGEYKFYYSNEKPEDIASGLPDEFERYLVRWRHKWDIDPQTHFISEVYKIADKKRKLLDPQANLLKDYFYREYEADSQPLTYAVFHHSFQNSLVDVFVQKRINHWFDQIDKLPEIKYSLPSFRIGESRFYFENSSSLVHFSKKASSIPVSPDEVDVTRLDTTNKLFLPLTRLSVLRFSPFLASRQTVYDKGADDSDFPARNIFYSGVDVSTKFYRTFDVKSNFLGMQLEALRHIITPSVSYAYNPSPNIPGSDLKQIDSIDAITRNSSLTLELSNKLQAKRRGASVDLVDFRVQTAYLFEPKTGGKDGSSLSDFLFDLKLLPYSCLWLQADATLKHSGSRSEEGYNHITNANYDLGFTFAKERILAIGQRYQRKGSNEITNSLTWRLNPKWKITSYQRYNLSNDSDLELNKGWREQQYGVERDLHCWIMGYYFNTQKSGGSTFWVTFKLKSFPETDYNLDQAYHGPKSGSQINP